MTTTKKGEHLDKIEVRNSLQDPHALLFALGLLPSGGGIKRSYTIPCLWCLKKTLSIWVGRDSVIGTCRKGDCMPGGNRTFSPFDVIAKARGWAMSGPDFNLRVLPFAAEIGGVTAASQHAPAAAPNAAQNTPTAAPKAEQTHEAPRVSEVQPETAEEEEPIWLRPHPDRTQDGWAFIKSLGIDPYTIRRLGWLVLEDRKDQPAEMLRRARSGYGLWRSIFGPEGDHAGWCALMTSDTAVAPWISLSDDDEAEAVLANEFGEAVLEDGPDALSAWPAADHRHPTLYLAADPIDFAHAEVLLQLRLQPLWGLLGDELPAKAAARIPTAARRVLLHTGQPTGSLRRLAEQLGAQLLHLSRLSSSIPTVDELNFALSGSQPSAQPSA